MKQTTAESRLALIIGELWPGLERVKYTDGDLAFILVQLKESEAQGFEAGLAKQFEIQQVTETTPRPGGREVKLILDACCGGRMFWFNKQNPDTLYIDNRTAAKGHIQNNWNPNHEVAPDVVMDFRKMDLTDKSFKLVVFDPPHLTNSGPKSVMGKKYGKLCKETWEVDLTQGFNECWRVLDDYGTLIFKWSEVSIPLKRVLALFPQRPLFGHVTAKSGKSIWCVFLKKPTQGGESR